MKAQVKETNKIDQKQSDNLQYDIFRVIEQLKEPIPPKIYAETREKIIQMLENIGFAYNKGNYKLHNKYSLGFLKYSRQVTLITLLNFQDLIIKYTKKYGSNPYLFWIIEYKFRMGNYKSEKANSICLRYEKIWKGHYKRDKRKWGQASVPIRVKRSNAYQLYTENVGYAVAELMYSNFGSAHIQLGFYPDNFVKAVGMIAGCKEKEESEKDQPRKLKVISDATKVDTCVLLGEMIRNQFNKDDLAGFNGAIDSIRGTGFKHGMNDCLVSLKDDTVSEMIETFESYLNCRMNQYSNDNWVQSSSWVMSGNGNLVTGFWGPDIVSYGDRFYERVATGNNVSGRAGYQSGTQTQLFEAVGPETQNPVKRIQTETTIINGQPTKIHAIMYDADGRPLEEYTYEFDKNGNKNITSSTYHSYDNNGRWTHSVTYDTNPNTGNERTTFKDSQGTAAFEKLPNGNTRVTTETAGNNGEKIVVETEIDGKGNTVSSKTSTSASTPVDDMFPDPCGEILTHDIREKQMESWIPKIATQIIPSPDHVEPLESPCFNSFSGGGLKKCTSVMLCIEPVDQVDDCNCNAPDDDANLPPHRAGICAQIQCMDGYECDPSTGGCKPMGPGGKHVIPGNIPPIPVMELNSTFKGISYPPIFEKDGTVDIISTAKFLANHDQYQAPKAPTHE